MHPVAGGPRELMPPGARTLVLCRYRELNPAATALRLRSARLVTDRVQVVGIATALNALPSEGSGFHCPMDDGSAILATFSYPQRAAVVVRVGLRGCRTVTGPHLPIRTAISLGGARLISRLEHLVP